MAAGKTGATVTSGVPSLAGRRRVLRQLGGMAALPLLPALAACSNKTSPLKVAIQPWCSYQFMVAAQRLGWIPDSMMQVFTTDHTEESVHALQQGVVDAAALSLDEVLTLVSHGMDLKVVLLFDISVGADALLVRPAIRSLAELRGHRIGVDNTNIGTLMLQNLLRAGGLAPDDVKVYQLGPDHIQDWEGQELDGLVTYDPWRSRLLQGGLRTLFDSRSLPLTILDVLAVRSDALSSKEDQVEDLIRGHFRALSEWHTNVVDMSYRLAPLLKVDMAQVAATFSGLDLPDLLSNRDYLTAPAEKLGKAVATIKPVLASAGKLGADGNFQQLFVPDYLPGKT